ncbi:MAG: hypothetical protein ACK59M_16435 [Pseudomonadota bacterium]
MATSGKRWTSTDGMRGRGGSERARPSGRGGLEAVLGQPTRPLTREPTWEVPRGTPLAMGPAMRVAVAAIRRSGLKKAESLVVISTLKGPDPCALAVPLLIVTTQLPWRCWPPSPTG